MTQLRVLVTGAFGNLGSMTVERLLQATDVEITCFGLGSDIDKRMQKKLSKIGKFRTVWGDIRDEEVVNNAVNGQNVIIHMAAILVPKTEENPTLAYDINVEGLKNIIRAAEMQESRPRLIFTSSVSCMGPSAPDRPPWKVSDPLIPTRVYTKTKIEGEKLIHSSKLPWVILRVTISLPFVANDYMMKYLFDTALDQKIEFLDPRDAAEAFVKAVFVEADQIVGKILFIAGGKKCQMTQGELLSRQFNAMGIPMLPPSAFIKPKKPEEWAYMNWMDTAESERLLNYQKRSLDDYLDEFMRQFGFKRYLIKLIKNQAVKKMLKGSTYYSST